MIPPCLRPVLWSAIDQVGIFDGAKVDRLVAKLTKRAVTPSEADNMALMAVATTQLLAQQFLSPRALPAAHLDAVTVLAA